MIENPIFLSVIGSHLYKIPDPEDIDIRGAHILTEERFWESWGKNKPKYVIEKNFADIDLVSHEIGAYLKEMVKPNVNFLEQVLSPLSIVRSKYYDELKEIARDCISKKMYAHWKGFAQHTSYHAIKEDYTKPKRNLYLLRIYYQGVYIARNWKLRSDFETFKELDCFNDDLVKELFDCKINKTNFNNKQNFLTHCAEMEKLLAEEIDKTKLREDVHPQTKKAAKEFFEKIYKEEFGWVRKHN